MNRRDRQNAILTLVRERALSTQAEVAAALKDAGFEVVQTTVSRDIADLGLVKVRAPSGRLVYAPPGTSDYRPSARARRGDAPVRRQPRSRRLPGRRQHAVRVRQRSRAGNRRSGHPGIAGTLAGDNSILVVARDGTPAAALADELTGYLLQGAA